MDDLANYPVVLVTLVIRPEAQLDVVADALCSLMREQNCDVMTADAKTTTLFRPGKNDEQVRAHLSKLRAAGGNQYGGQQEWGGRKV